MTELNTPDRNEDIGAALHRLDVGSSRLDFWDDVRSDLIAAEAPKLAESAGDIAPHWISSPQADEDPSTTNGRRVWSSKPWIALAAAAALVLIVGLAVVLRPGGDNTTQLDVANPDVANPAVADPDDTAPDDNVDPDGPSSVTPDAGRPSTSTNPSEGSANMVDYSQPPTVADLPAGSLVVAGSPNQDLTLINWPIPGGQADDVRPHNAATVCCRS